MTFLLGILKTFYTKQDNKECKKILILRKLIIELLKALRIVYIKKKEKLH